MSARPVSPTRIEHGNWPWSGIEAVYTPDDEVIAGGWLEGRWLHGIEHVGPDRRLLSRGFNDAGVLLEVTIAGPAAVRPGRIRLSYDAQGRLIGYNDCRSRSEFRLSYGYDAEGEVEFEDAFRRRNGAEQRIGVAQRFHGVDGELVRIEVRDRLGRVRETRDFLAQGHFAESQSFNELGQRWSHETTEFRPNGRLHERRTTYFDTRFDPPRPLTQWVETMEYDRVTQLPVECRIIKSRPFALDAQGRTVWRVRVFELIRYDPEHDGRTSSDETRYYRSHGGENQRVILTFDYDQAGQLDSHTTEEADLSTGRTASRIVRRSAPLLLP